MLFPALAIAALGSMSAVQDTSLITFLAERMGFSDHDLRNVRRGQVVVKTVSRASDREIAIFGIARVEGTPESFLERFKSLDPLRASTQVRQFGQFASPPGPADLASFSLTDSDMKALKDCRMGNCDVKLPADMIRQVMSLDADADTFATVVSGLITDRLLDYVRSYQELGDSALVVYDDRREPMALAEGFRFLLAEAPYLFSYVPELDDYLQRYPADTLPSVQDVFYWSVEDIGLRPLTTLTHMIIDDRAPGDAPRALVMFKQIYASHYFLSSLRIMGFAVDHEDQAADGPTFYLLYLDRSLFDSGIGGLKRHAAEGHLQDYVRRRLTAFQSS